MIRQLVNIMMTSLDTVNYCLLVFVTELLLSIKMVVVDLFTKKENAVMIIYGKEEKEGVLNEIYYK